MATARWSRGKRIAVIALAVLVVLGAAVLAAYNYASRTIEDRVLDVLGPESTLEAVKIRATDVSLSGVHVKAPKGWPTDTALKAARIVVTPKLSQLFSDHMEITSVRVEQAYLSALRPRSGGGLRILPNQKERAKKNQGDGKRGADISSVRLDGCTLELYDGAVALKPERVRIDAVKGTIKDIQVPDLKGKTQIALDGVIKGPNHQGTVSVRGWVDVAAKSAEITLEVRNVDLANFEPYLVTKTKAGIDSGTFNLDLKSSVRNNVMHAPGTLSVNALKLASPESPGSALASIPRRAAIGALSDESGRITVPFNLDGNLDDPTFSLAGKTGLQTGIAVAKAMGLSFEGLVRAFIIIIHGFGGALGHAAGAA